MMFNRTNCDRKAQLSGILTEPLNPRGINEFDCMLVLNKTTKFAANLFSAKHLLEQKIIPKIHFRKNRNEE